MISSFVVPITHFLGSQTDNVKILFPSTCIGTDGMAHVMSCSRLAPTLSAHNLKWQYWNDLSSNMAYCSQLRILSPPTYPVPHVLLFLISAIWQQSEIVAFIFNFFSVQNQWSFLMVKLRHRKEGSSPVNIGTYEKWMVIDR